MNRFLIWVYAPVVNWVLRHRWLTLACALLLMAATVFPYMRLGKEFMPPLNEGTLLYMPTAAARYLDHRSHARPANYGP